MGVRVDGREVQVAGRLLAPWTRRTNDILRLSIATVVLTLVITSSLITRRDWVGLERSISDIVGVLTVAASVASRTSFGGTAPANVRRMAAEWRERLA